MNLVMILSGSMVNFIRLQIKVYCMQKKPTLQDGFNEANNKFILQNMPNITGLVGLFFALLG